MMSRFRAENVDYIGQTHPEEFPALGESTARMLVTGVGCSDHILDGAERPVCGVLRSTAGSAARVSSVPCSTAPLRRVKTVKNDVAEFSGAAQRTPVRLAVDDDAHTDSPANRHDHHMVVTPSVSKQHFRKRERVDVVLDKDRQPKVVGQQRRERHVAPAEVWRVLDDAGIRVDDAGNADADAEQALAWNPALLDCRFDHGRNQLALGVGISFKANVFVVAVQDLGFEVGDGADNAPFHQLDADGEAGRWIQTEQDLAAAAGVFAFSTFQNEALFRATQR